MTTAELPPPTEVVLGVDVGTTAAKVVAFGLGSSWRHVEVREYPLLQPGPGWQVQDPATILTAVEEALAACVVGAGRARVVGLSLSAAMHGLVALDDDLAPMTPLVTWADGRAAEQARALRLGPSAATLHRRTGTPVHPMSPLTKLMWFSRHEPALTARARWWAGLKDLVVTQLTGVLVTELSSASGTGLLDLRRRTWDADAMDLAGVRPDQLPDVVATTTVHGLSQGVAARVGLPAGLPVVVGAADGPLATLATGAVRPGVVGLSVGTSGAVRTSVPAPVVDDAGRLFCYALTEDHWVLGGAVSNGGSVLRWVRDLLGAGTPADLDDADVLALADGVPAGSDGLVVMPYLLPERAPLWDPDVPGAVLGLRRHHGAGHLVRAAVEGVAMQLAAVVDALDEVHPVHEVRATGGVFRSPLWRDVVAAAVGRPLVVTGGVEGTAAGAAALGLHALGRAPDPVRALDLIRPATGETPSSDAAGPAGRVEPVSAAAVATYRALRAGTAPLVHGYAQAAAALAPRTDAPWEDRTPGLDGNSRQQMAATVGAVGS